ncbi:MAG: hypothetical protein ACRD1C_03900 [Terriglobales bacterium]
MKTLASDVSPASPPPAAPGPYQGLLESVALAANQAGDFQEALELALVRVCEATGWRLGHALVALPEADTGRPGTALTPAGNWHGAGGETYAALRTAALPEGPFAGLPGRVVATARATWICDLSRGGEESRAALAVGAGLRAAYAFPVLAGRAVAAV